MNEYRRYPVTMLVLNLHNVTNFASDEREILVFILETTSYNLNITTELKQVKENMRLVLPLRDGSLSNCRFRNEIASSRIRDQQWFLSHP